MTFKRCLIWWPKGPLAFRTIDAWGATFSVASPAIVAMRGRRGRWHRRRHPPRRLAIVAVERSGNNSELCRQTLGKLSFGLAAERWGNINWTRGEKGAGVSEYRG